MKPPGDVQNFITLGQPLLGEKYVTQKEKKRKKNNPKNSGHYVPLNRPRAAHALRSDQHLELWEIQSYFLHNYVLYHMQTILHICHKIEQINPSGNIWSHPISHSPKIEWLVSIHRRWLGDAPLPTVNINNVIQLSFNTLYCSSQSLG